MANKRYYWLKLQNDFFNSKRIKKLRKLGADYVIIYLKMQLLSLKTNGVLEFTGLEKNFADELALDLDEDTDKVQLTLSYLQSCGLLECHEDIFFLPYVENCTGSETAVAQRVREHRAKQSALQCNTDVTHMKQIGNVEIDIEKELDTEIEKKKNKKEKPVRHKYGEYGNVLLSDEDMEKLKKEFPGDYKERIERLSGYMASKGATYKDHLATIRNWARKDMQNIKPNKATGTEWDIPDGFIVGGN